MRKSNWAKNDVKISWHSGLKMSEDSFHDLYVSNLIGKWLLQMIHNGKKSDKIELNVNRTCWRRATKNFFEYKKSWMSHWRHSLKLKWIKLHCELSTLTRCHYVTICAKKINFLPSFSLHHFIGCVYTRFNRTEIAFEC